MKGRKLWGAVFCVLLLTASPARAVITVTLENPGNMQEVSGIALISGWAFSSTGAPVTVRSRANGVTGDVISCCVARADVQAVVPGAPLNTGFGALTNYGIQAAGANTIGVEVSAPGETTVIVDHAVTVAKPGDAEFLNAFDLANANSAVAGLENEIVIGGAQVSSGGGTTTTNLRVNFAISSQSLVIGEAFNGANAALFNPVQAIFTSRCATASQCHTGGVPAASQDLSAGQSFRNIVAARSVEDPSRPRVSPGDAEGSYLYQKIIPNGNIVAGTGRMPLGCSGSNCLSEGEIQTIRDWINDGARPPQ
jgi:hypothetical protein